MILSAWKGVKIYIHIFTPFQADNITNDFYYPALFYSISPLHSLGDGYRTLYAHMSAFAVKQGDVVQQGQIIGYVGDTGYSFGCHCHFEMFGPGGRFSAQLLFPTL